MIQPSLTAWTVQVLGQAALRDPDGVPHPLERKAAALLAYLAIEGHTPRSRLIGLLWPDTREHAARNNLVHLLRKLQQRTGIPLIEGRETLSLHPEVRVDLHSLFPAEGLAQGCGPSGQSTPLLGTHDFDDCPELDDWLRAERERLEEWALLALRERAQALEQRGEYDAALGCVLRLLERDPLSEDAHHRLMRLHALTGNRHRAMRVYQRLCTLLQREFGAEPLPETVQLAQSLNPLPRFTPAASPPALMSA